MPLAGCSRLCSWDSAWEGVFESSARSSAFVIVTMGYHLLLVFFNVKPFYFIRFIDVRNMYSRQIMNKYGANVAPCMTLATMIKMMVSPFVSRPLFL